MTHNGTLALAVTDPLDCNTIDYVAKKAAIRVMSIVITFRTDYLQWFDGVGRGYDPLD